MPSSNCLEINFSAILHNLNLFAASSHNLMVMVKANAYGTDVHTLSKALQWLRKKNVAFLGVSHISEAIALRQSGIQLPIFAISVPPYEAEVAAFYNITCAVSTEEEVLALQAAAQKFQKKIPVHLHINTGMMRFGADLSDAYNTYQKIVEAPCLYLEGVMTHFAAAEDPGLDEFTQLQIVRFQEFLIRIKDKPKWIHAANSAGAARFKLPFCNLARIGLGFLGYADYGNAMRSCLKLTSRLASIQTAQVGESVGYNRGYLVQTKEERIGVVAIGYHDGLERSASGKGYVMLHGKKAPQIGTICMDFMMVNLTEIPEAKIGDEATIFDETLSPTLWASWATTDIRELLCRLSPRVKRLWKDLPLMIPSNNKESDETSTARLPDSLFTIEKDPSPR